VLSRTGRRRRSAARPECAPRWQARLRAALPEIRLTLLLGRHAQAHHLAARRRATLTETVRAFLTYLPDHFPLPHPSPRNGPWLLRHPWFEDDVLPALRAEVGRALQIAVPGRYSAAPGSLRRCLR
jgi:uracil-DNA glycosylase